VRLRDSAQAFIPVEMLSQRDNWEVIPIVGSSGQLKTSKLWKRNARHQSHYNAPIMASGPLQRLNSMINPAKTYIQVGQLGEPCKD
jgi:hypothetical protein